MFFYFQIQENKSKFKYRFKDCLMKNISYYKMKHKLKIFPKAPSIKPLSSSIRISKKAQCINRYCTVQTRTVMVRVLVNLILTDTFAEILNNNARCKYVD